MELYEVSKAAVRDGCEFKYSTISGDFLEIESGDNPEGKDFALITLFEGDDNNTASFRITERYTGCDLYIEDGFRGKCLEINVDRNLMVGFCKAFLGANEAMEIKDRQSIVEAK